MEILIFKSPYSVATSDAGGGTNRITTKSIQGPALGGRGTKWKEKGTPILQGRVIS
jgi:hypothetical protein